MTFKQKSVTPEYLQCRLNKAAKKAEQALHAHLHKGIVQSEFEAELFNAYSELKIAIIAHEKGGATA